MAAPGLNSDEAAGQSPDVKKPPGSHRAVFAVIGVSRLLLDGVLGCIGSLVDGVSGHAAHCGSSVSNAGSSSRSACINSDSSCRSSCVSSDCDSRSGLSNSRSHNSGFFFFAASGQSNSSQHSGQQDRLVHTCPQNSLNENAITGNFLKSNNIDLASRQLLLKDFGMTRRGNLERFHRLAAKYSSLN
jgi:hypothetical protein